MAYIKCLKGLAHVIPDGKTVTPTGDVQIWLHCANIWDKSYTTVSEVLNDSTTTFVLMTNDNAMDYMVRAVSTTWVYGVCADDQATKFIGAYDYSAYTLLTKSATWRSALKTRRVSNVVNVRVPKMTSNTTPKGVASSNSHSYTHNVAYRAFDGDSTTPWGDNVANHWVQYEFTRDMLINYATYLEWNTTQGANTITIQVSDDGSTFVDLATTTTLGNNNYQILSLPNNTHKYYRALYNGGTSGFYYLDFLGRQTGGVQNWLRAAGITDKTYTTISEVCADSTTLATLIASTDACDYLVTAKAFIDQDICENQAFMTALGNSNYASNLLLNDEDWYEAIKASTYASLVINATVPKMTSATTPSGEVLANGYSGSYYPYFAFSQGSTYTSLWMWAGNATNVGYLGYDFQKPVKVVGVMWRNRNNSSSIRPVKTLKVQGSNDGTTWTDVSSEIQSNGSGQYVQTKAHFSNYVAYSKYRVFITDVYDTAAVGIQQLQFYGREDVT